MRWSVSSLRDRSVCVDVLGARRKGRAAALLFHLILQIESLGREVRVHEAVARSLSLSLPLCDCLVRRVHWASYKAMMKSSQELLATGILLGAWCGFV